MASSLEKGNRFFDIMHRTNSDLIDILSGIVGMPVGEPETGILYVQDTGEKKAGRCYINKQDGELYTCTQNTSNTYVSEPVFKINDVKYNTEMLDSIYGNGRNVSPYISTAYLGPTQGEDLKYIKLVIDYVDGDVINVNARYINYKDPIGIQIFDIVNYFFSGTNRDFGTKAYRQILDSTKSYGISEIFYKVAESENKMYIVFKASTSSFYFKTMYLTLYTRTITTRRKSPIAEFTYINETTYNQIGGMKTLEIVDV